jgi:PAS domain S-box-containing protein
VKQILAAKGRGLRCTRLRAVTVEIEKNSDVLSLVSAGGEILYTSASSTTVFGFRPEEVVGRKTFDLIHPEDRKHSCRALLRVLTKPPGPLQIEVRIRRKDGSCCLAECTITNLLDEPRIGAIVVNCRAISSTRKSAKEQEQRHARELVLSNARLDDCVYAVAHDFREPLRTISMFTSLLTRKTEMDPGGKLLAQYIVDGVARMSALLEGLHDFALRGFDSPQPLELKHVVAEALQNLGHAIATSQAIVTVHPLPFVQGSQIQLLRVFQNLILNAIKYRSEMPVEINVTAEPIGHDWIIKVKDNGIGIAPEYQERVFGLLERLHGPEIPGAGIGLAICKKIIEAMGGAIWVESEVGSGSIFCFTIAAARETDKNSAASHADPHPTIILDPIGTPAFEGAGLSICMVQGIETKRVGNGQ